MPSLPVDPPGRPRSRRWAGSALGAAAMAVVAAACGRSTPPTAPGAADSLTTPGLHVRTLEVEGTPRRYRVFLPASADPRRPTPVILVLHGFPPVDMGAVSGIEVEAERRGFLAVYPESAWGEDWVQGCDCTPNALRGVDDLAYFDALLADLASVVSVDATRRFVSGFSNGGMMTYRLACDRPSTFAGFAAVGAAVWRWHQEHCGAGPPVPLLMIHGTEDPSFPWEGTTVELVTGARMEQLPLPEHAAWWAARNGCLPGGSDEALEDRADDGTRVHARSWSGCGADTRFYRIDGGGHTWPGTDVTFHPSLGRRSLDLDATSTIVDFFLQN